MWHIAWLFIDMTSVQPDDVPWIVAMKSAHLYLQQVQDDCSSANHNNTSEWEWIH